MGAARYVGRIGGLAVALGVGTAVITGQGVAYADEPNDSNDTVNTTNTDTGGSTDTGTVKVNKGPLAKHRLTDGTSLADTVKGIADKVTTENQKRIADARKSIDDALAGVVNAGVQPRATDTIKTKAKAKQSSKDSEVVAASDPGTGPADNSVVQDTAALKQPRVKAWLDSPRVAAARQANPVPTSSSLWTPATALTSLGQDSTAPLRRVVPTNAAVSGILTTISNALSPFSNNGGGAPVGGSVADLLLLAGTRRELTSQALAVDAPTVGVFQGVITGCVVGTTCATADGSTYTLSGKPEDGGKVAVNPTTGAFTFLPFADQSATNGPTGEQSFSVIVAQNSQLTTILTGVPIIGSKVIAPVIIKIQTTPVLGDVLAPVFGTATVVTVTADIDDLRGEEETPIAYTTMVTSWDGTQISTNFFPAIGTDDDGQAGFETIFNGPGLGQAGATSPTDPFVGTFRAAGYNVVTWDPRGEYDSGGRLQLDSPQYEGQDVQQLITWAAGLDGVELSEDSEGNPIAGDPQMGMVGVSYGGGIQWVTAASDNRVDAIAPGWSWNTLPSSLYPESAFKTAYSSLLLLDLVTTGARINPQIYGGILTGALLGVLTPGQIQLLQTSGPGETVRSIDVPVLIIQGTVDVLFPLQQSLDNLGYLENNPNVKVIWYCGGHGTCLPGQGNPDADDVWVMAETQQWMDTYVKDEAPEEPFPGVFEWTDQNGVRWASDVRPSDPLFNDGFTPLTTWTDGKILPIIPIVGGSGPSPKVPFPYSLGDGSPATNAVTIPLDNPEGTTNVVGAPVVTVTYSGIGTSRHIYGQIVDTRGTADTSDDVVVGNLVTQMPVTLNGREQTQTYYLNDIAYTMDENSTLELQLVTTATPFLNLTQYGFVNIKSVEVTLPTTSSATEQPPFPPVPGDAELIAV